MGESKMREGPSRTQRTRLSINQSINHSINRAIEHAAVAISESQNNQIGLIVILISIYRSCKTRHDRIWDFTAHCLFELRISHCHLYRRQSPLMSPFVPLHDSSLSTSMRSPINRAQAAAKQGQQHNQYSAPSRRSLAQASSISCLRTFRAPLSPEPPCQSSLEWCLPCGGLAIRKPPAMSH